MATTQEAGSNLVDCILLLVDDAKSIDQAWPFVSEQLQKKPFGITNYCSVDDIRGMIDKGESQLWVAGYDRNDKGLEIGICMIVSYLKYPLRKVMFISYVGGYNIKGFINAWPHILDHAKNEGCTHVEAHGRKGWARFSKILGFEMTSVNYSVPVFKKKELH
jgi:hypothetical protein